MARNELSHCASFPECVTIMLDEMASYNVSQGLLRACPGVGRDSRYSVYGTREKQHASASVSRDARPTEVSAVQYACETCALSCVVSRRLLVYLDARHTTVGRRPRGAHSLSL